MLTPSMAFAQGMMSSWINGTTSDEHTAQEETKGKIVWNKLQTKQLNCKNLTDDDYDVLGEYFMGISIGNTGRHAFMNQMMKNMMGEKGETQIHITLGKKSSGCNTSIPLSTGYNFVSMMGGWGGFGLGWLIMIVFMILFWLLIILGVISLFRYLIKNGINKKEKSLLEILKERYAKGEINKKEFEEKKKEIL
jgi:putative membrane protein